VHAIEVFSLLVVRLQIGVAERPRGRNSLMMLDAIEVTLAESGKACPVHLGITANDVMDSWMKRASLPISPHLVGFVAAIDEHFTGGHVCCLPRNGFTTLNNKDIDTPLSECPRSSAATHARTDDHY
jgi:hypothetical protein